MMENIQNDIGEKFFDGAVITTAGVSAIAEKDWVAHPAFDGVNLKEILSYDQTDNLVRSLIVRVEEGCELKEHVHDGEWETHEVLDGDGVATLADSNEKYSTGVVAVIPQGVRHSVRAGKDGLTLLAKFYRR